jgi:DNA-binding PadR family transcriptional regulator
MEDRISVADKYLVTMRIIQPARIQDVLSAYIQMWTDIDEARIKPILYALHEKMRAEGLLIDVRKGTYVLTAKGMQVASRLVKEREIDNRRLFLMKRQRRLYH